MYHKLYLKLFLLTILFSLTSQISGFGQNNILPFTPIPLTDFGAFKPVTNNWKVAGDVFFNPIKTDKPKVTSGTGILVNTPGKSNNGHLFTNLEHGDIELELDFMMAKGSNSGVYLMGRYEVQLFDSWGEKNPKFSDAGAIYQRWDEKRGAGREGYEGHQPLVNVSKAPGLWQHYRILFQAPRFNNQGQKIANARFLKVFHNQVLVQENIEVTGPTRAAAFEDEKPMGPLMIQGDHGAVAIRNIKYKLYTTAKVEVSNIRVSSYNGDYYKMPDFSKLTPFKEQESEYLQPISAARNDNYAGQLTGNITVPQAGQYLFQMRYAGIAPDAHFAANPSGAGILTISGKKVMELERHGLATTGIVELPAGTHPFTIQYYKRFWGRSNALQLFVEGPGVPRQAVGATPTVPDADPAGDIMVLADVKPAMLRSFIDFNGKKKTHAISIGEPTEVNYSLDLKEGALLQIWRGPFLKTTPMWHDRGEAQIASPMGSPVLFSDAPSLAQLADKNAAWPDSMLATANYRYWGYRLDNAGRPTFKYTLGTTEVQEQFIPEDNGRQLKHLYTLPGNARNIWCRAASGTIQKIDKDLYSVNDKQYLISFAGSKVQPIIRTVNGKQELLVPAQGNQISYNIIW